MIIEGREVGLSRPQKVLFPQVGVTKRDLARYLLRVSNRMMPHLRDRPLTVVRMPDGVDGPTFFQKNAPGHMPRWIPRCVATTRGSPIEYALVNEAPALVVLADQAVGELHGWVSTCSTPDMPDRIVVDLDPPRAGLFEAVREGAVDLARILEGRGARVFPMVTGSRGVHLVVPLEPQATSPQVNRFADALARALARHDPDRFTVEGRKASRGDRVYVDTLRNRRNQTSVVPYSPRIRAGASVAAPVTFAELEDEDLDPRGYTIQDSRDWLARGDPWKGFREHAVPLARLL